MAQISQKTTFSTECWAEHSLPRQRPLDSLSSLWIVHSFRPGSCLAQCGSRRQSGNTAKASIQPQFRGEYSSKLGTKNRPSEQKIAKKIRNFLEELQYRNFNNLLI